jgi:hypothetical protein
MSLLDEKFPPPGITPAAILPKRGNRRIEAMDAQGYTLYLCVDCDQWRRATDFYPWNNARSRCRVHSACRICDNAWRDERKRKARLNKLSRAISSAALPAATPALCTHDGGSIAPNDVIRHPQPPGRVVPCAVGLIEHRKHRSGRMESASAQPTGCAAALVHR